MGRLVWYAGVSTALATGVVVSAFNQRANFYSACIYLAQSNLCLMILINLILFIYGSFMYGLQRLCYGALRPIEIEQLYEKAWFSLTETCLAMTIFREEVGAWFLVMFVALLTGKVWGWIGDGRVEVLEQQPPANPRLFHIRLSISLAISYLYDIWLMIYCINTVIQLARPNMMVMFLFEFTILTTSSNATAFRYAISLIEASIVKKQTHDRLVERRREVRESREEMIRQREQATTAAAAAGEPAPTFTEALPSEDDVDEVDIEVPGWEAKGQWILTLDLVTDFIKLGIYLGFFFILLMFYGLPIHIMRDLFLTTRSFIKRLTAFLRYRRATQDMNKRYNDATVEDIAREDTCIICREEMRPWSVTNPEPPAGAPPVRPATTVNERSRPKKLPCGHILHLGCLKSWLERQQVCPTCRAPVVENAQNARPGVPNANPGAQGVPAPLDGQQDGAVAQPPPAGRGGRGMRMLNFGPLRVGFGQANLQDLAGMGAQPGQENAAQGARVYGFELGFPRRQQPQPLPQPPVTGGVTASNTLQDHLQRVEQHIVGEIRDLHVAQQELQLVQLLQVELARLRQLNNGGAEAVGTAPTVPQGQMGLRPTTHLAAPTQHIHRHGARSGTTTIPAGSADLPPGVSIPEGWSLLPLQRLDPPAGTQTDAASTAPATNSGFPNPSTTTQTIISPTPLAPGSISALPATTEGGSQASSAESSTAAIPTPPSMEASHSNQRNSDTPAHNIEVTPASATTPSDAQALPNWGSSQLFSNSSLTSSGASSNPAPTPTTSSSTTAGPAPETSEQQSESSQGGKGKGKAVTVEDTQDEAEGA